MYKSPGDSSRSSISNPKPDPRRSDETSEFPDRASPPSLSEYLRPTDGALDDPRERISQTSLHDIRAGCSSDLETIQSPDPETTGRRERTADSF